MEAGGDAGEPYCSSVGCGTGVDFSTYADYVTGSVLGSWNACVPAGAKPCLYPYLCSIP